MDKWKTSMKKILLTLLITSTILYAQNVIFENGFEQPAIQLTPLNDTGITWGVDYPSGNNATCTSNIASPQDCNQGRDFTHNDDSDGHAGFSFTKLDATGTPLVDQSVDYATTPWACVQDSVTGIVWEVKTTTAGIHNKDNTYRWGGITHQGSNFGTYYNDWDVLVNGTNSESLCGFNDWRVPNSTELMGIVDNSVYNPSIDTNYFPNTNSLFYWSALPISNSSDNALLVGFGDGFYGYTYRNDNHHVRLLSFGQ